MTRLKTQPTSKREKMAPTDSVECHPHARYRNPQEITADHRRWGKAKRARKRAHDSRRINARVAKR